MKSGDRARPCHCERPTLQLDPDTRVVYCFDCGAEVRPRAGATVIDAVRTAAGEGVQLDPSAVEAVAQRVAELLGGAAVADPRHHAEDGALVDAATIATRFGVSRDYVYRNAEELGAIKLPTRAKRTDPDPDAKPPPEPRPRLRFDPERVAELLGRKAPAASTPPRNGKPALRRARPELLEIRGRSG
ncbi:MAG: hypothetical protein ACR2G3_00645 [Solirubrobacterales bacterium]